MTRENIRVKFLLLRRSYSDIESSSTVSHHHLLLYHHDHDLYYSIKRRLLKALTAEWNYMIIYMGVAMGVVQGVHGVQMYTQGLEYQGDLFSWRVLDPVVCYTHFVKKYTS